MKYKELLIEYNLLLSENSRLTEENNRLKAQFGIMKSKPSKNSITKIIAEKTKLDDESTGGASFLNVNNTSDSISKIKLFMSLFKGRDDVYAKRWENKKKATSGYSPVC
ncbi:MAG: helicase, partial [Deltaproteobacteria bacterium]|nr:helicase [Deltaproteobacteria bacterium]